MPQEEQENPRADYLIDAPNDTLTFVNGPFDGAALELAESPAIVGSDPGCAVLIQMDETVRAQHARATAVRRGYRIRQIKGGRTCVRGKRVGRIGSTIARPGDVVQFGQTQLILRCANDGLSRRVFESPLEFDLAWGLRHLTPIIRLATRLMNFLRRHWIMVTILILGIVYFGAPRVVDSIRDAMERIQAWF